MFWGDEFGDCDLIGMRGLVSWGFVDEGNDWMERLGGMDLENERRVLGNLGFGRMVCFKRWRSG